MPNNNNLFDFLSKLIKIKNIFNIYSNIYHFLIKYKIEFIFYPKTFSLKI